MTAIFSDPIAPGYRLVTRSGATVSFGAFGAHRTGKIISCRRRR